MVYPLAKSPQIVVIGGGPAGATVGTICAQAGYSVQILEREKGPRFHIGESLMPATYSTLKRLGALDKIKASRFQKKYSVQFVSESGKESQPFYFFENNPHEAAQTWQVVREEFDSMLLENAKEHGVKVSYGLRAMDVLMDGTKAIGVHVRDSEGREQDIFCDVVVDATGQSSLIMNKLGLKVANKHLRKASVWTYYKGASREAGLDEGATLVCATKDKKGWFWYIPQHNDMLSVGVVSSMDELFGPDCGTHEEVFQRELSRCPAVLKRVSIGERVGPYYATKDFSYHSKQISGPGWVLVGDAFGFLDPIYSSGVFLALKSGEMAADAIIEGFARGDLGQQTLGSWQPEFLQGMNRMKRLVYAFYEGFNFGTFIRKHPEMKRHITDLLVGDLFKKAVDEVALPMDAMRRELCEASGMVFAEV